MTAVVVSVPEAIEDYFRAVDDDVTEALVACFTDDAEVTDEGALHRGPEEIRAWREQTRSAYQYTATVLGTERDGDRYVITPCSPGTSPAVRWRCPITSRCGTG